MLLVLSVGALEAAPARLVKVLPHFVDQQGRVALNPSLYERDAYQAHLRANPVERGGLMFEVQWKSRQPVSLTLRVEMRGNRGKTPTTHVLEQVVRPRGIFSTWSRVSLSGEPYTKFGELSAWRATLWSGEQQIAEQKSFLW